MRFAEILREDTSDMLELVLRQQQGEADSEDMPIALHFKSNYKPIPDYINKNMDEVMINLGIPQFNFATFNAMYEQNPNIAQYVEEYDNEKIILKTQAQSVRDQEQADQNAVDTRMNQQAMQAATAPDPNAAAAADAAQAGIGSPG